MTMNDEDAITILQIAGFALETIGEMIGSHLDISDEELERIFSLIGEQQFEFDYCG